MLKHLIAVAATALMLAGLAAAQSPPPGPAKDPGTTGQKGRLAACRADAAAFCQGIEAGRGRRLACLTENKARLSPACAAVVEARNVGLPAPAGAAAPATPAADAPPKGKGEKGARGGGLAACRTDVATFCQNEAKGGGRRIACLRANQDKLDPACQAAIKDRPAAREGSEVTKSSRAACKADVATHCAGLQKGGGRIVQCLTANRDKLSPGCQETLPSGRQAARPPEGQPAPSVPPAAPAPK